MPRVFRSIGFRVCGTIGLMLMTTLVYAESHEHEASERIASPSLNHGKKWVTDAALQQGMEAIRQAMAASQEGIEKAGLTSEDYKRLGAAVDKSITDIVKNCKLPKETDKAFHGIVLADLNQGTELMRTATKIQAQRVGALGILQSLRNYGEYFQHPGWPLSNTKQR